MRRLLICLFAAAPSPRVEATRRPRPASRRLKPQEVGAYTCEGGEAAVRPLAFTCLAGDNEITASEP